jgi:hypothetical protein
MGFKKPILRADGALLTPQVQQFDGITSIDVPVAGDASEALIEGLKDDTLAEISHERPELKGQASFAERDYEVGSRKVLRLYFAAGDVGGKMMPDDDLD